MGKRLVQAIKQAAGQLGRDEVQIFLGVVIDNSVASTEGSITVQVISGKNISIFTNINSDYLVDNLGQTQVISDQDANEQLNLQAGGTNYLNVELQAQPGDWHFQIPSLGSYVRVCSTKFQTPFVLQYQDIDSTWSSIGQTSLQTNSGGHIISASGSQIQTTPTGNTFTVSTSDNNTNITQTNNSVGITINEGATVNLDTKFDVKANNGAEIVGDTKISIKNNSQNLATLLSQLCSQLNTLTTALSVLTVTCASSGSPSSPPLNASAISAVGSQISTISSNLSNLLE